MGTTNTATLLENITSVTGFIITALMPFILVSIGIFITIKLAEYLQKIMKTPQDIEGDLHRQNYITAIQLGNEEALLYEEKMGEKVGTSEDLINLRRTDRM